MIKYNLAGLIILFTSAISTAQSDSSSSSVTHYVGIQANQLLREILNFGGSSSPIDNPFLISYSLNSKNSGWGFSTGFGYTYNQFEEGDPFNPLETTIKDLFIRVGIDKKSKIGKKWILAWGADIIHENSRNKTVSQSGFGDFESKTIKKTFGFGPRVGLNFLVTERIMLGTEATYYFKSIKESQSVTDQPKQNDKFKDFSIIVPAVLYISIVF